MGLGLEGRLTEAPPLSDTRRDVLFDLTKKRRTVATRVQRLQRTQPQIRKDEEGRALTDTHAHSYTHTRARSAHARRFRHEKFGIKVKKKKKSQQVQLYRRSNSSRHAPGTYQLAGQGHARLHSNRSKPRLRVSITSRSDDTSWET